MTIFKSDILKELTHQTNAVAIILLEDLDFERFYRKKIKECSHPFI